jgi:multicomponent Na+:H+ antiporter subunit E
MTSQPSNHPMRRVRPLTEHWRALLLLAAVWVLLWGDLSWANVLGGIAVGAVVVVLFPLPRIATRGTLRIGPFLALAGRFVVEVFTASFQVAWLALRPGPQPRGGVVGVRLRNPNDVFLTVTAEITSLVPGSVVVEAHRRTGMLYMHVLDLEASGGPEGVRESTLDLEARVLRAFATDAVLHRLGLDGPRTSHKPSNGPSSSEVR